MIMKTAVFIRTTNIYDDSRATKEIVAVIKAGYFVVVLGWDRNGLAFEKSQKVFEEYSEQISFDFFSCPLPNGIGVKNIDKLFKWSKWIKHQLKALSRIDIIYICNLDSGIGLKAFCKKRNIPYFYDIYDYYIDSHNIPKFLVPLVEYMECDLINNAHTTVICTEERKSQISKAHPQNLIVVHNSPDMQQQIQSSIEYDYVYCGSLCEKRLIKEILNEYHKHSTLKFVFAGNDSYRSFVEEFAKKYNNLDFAGTITYSEVLDIESKALAISAIYEPSIRNHQLCAPNKFYEALALAKPVIVCKGTGIDNIVRKNKIGIVIGYNAEEFYDAVIWLKNNPNEARTMGEKARLLYEEKYRWSLMEAKIINSLQIV